MPESYNDLFRELASLAQTNSTSRPENNRDKFQKLIFWIEQNGEKNITLNDLVKVSGLSLYEMTTLFMVKTKLSPLQFIKEFRQYKAHIAAVKENEVDNTYALYDPRKK
jgi:transcriptional regulator GlxA family with amidase domain